MPVHRKVGQPSACKDGGDYCANLRIEMYVSTPRILAELRQYYTELHMDSVVRRMPLRTGLDLLRKRGRTKLFFCRSPVPVTARLFEIQCWYGGRISCIPNLKVEWGD